VRKKVNDDCVTCHMPNSGSIDIPHVTVHDHYIRKPVKKEEVEKVRKFIGLKAVNEEHPSDHTMAKAYLQQYDKFEYNSVFLDSAKKYLKDNTSANIAANFHELIHLSFIRKDYALLLSYVDKLGAEQLLRNTLVKKSWDNRDAWTAYRIGEAYYNSGDAASAYRFFQKADDLSPFNPEFRNKLGSALLAQKNVAGAVAAFESVLAENPNFVPAMTNLGYVSLISGNPAAAEELYRKAKKLDPDDVPLLMNIAGLHIFKKEYADARKVLQDLLKRQPDHEQAKMVLEQLKTMK
jgi:Tfp pilus assembly protein PilF